jgi:hypothetical protein
MASAEELANALAQFLKHKQIMTSAPPPASNVPTWKPLLIDRVLRRLVAPAISLVGSALLMLGVLLLPAEQTNEKYREYAFDTTLSFLEAHPAVGALVLIWAAITPLGVLSWREDYAGDSVAIMITLILVALFLWVVLTPPLEALRDRRAFLWPAWLAVVAGTIVQWLALAVRDKMLRATKSPK